MPVVRYDPGTESAEMNGESMRVEEKVQIDDGTPEVNHPPTWYNKIKNAITPFVMSFGFRVFGVILIILDIVLVIVDLAVTDKPPNVAFAIAAVSFAIAIFFFIDVLLRIFVEGFKEYFSSKLNILDAGIVGVTMIVTFVYTFSDFSGATNIPRMVNFLRALRIVILIRIFRLASQKKQLEKVTRRMVSENKRRYQKDGFDLDLTYITGKQSNKGLDAHAHYHQEEESLDLVRRKSLLEEKQLVTLRAQHYMVELGKACESSALHAMNRCLLDRVIAMSFPSAGKQSFYRNPIQEVARFLDTKHKDHYKIYNLCSEKGYDPKYFHYRVERIFIDDHNVPALEDMLKFTASVREWMAEDPQNVIAIHCKGGKGRTGTMVCTWLVDSDQFESAKESLDYFGERRTDKSTSTKFQGVETPSQSRYVGYYEVMKNKYKLQLPPEKKLIIKSIRIHSIQDKSHKFNILSFTGVGKNNGSDLKLQIIAKKEVVFQCISATQENCKLFVDAGNNAAIITLEHCPVISGDVKVRFESSAGLPIGYDGCPLYFWFNTSFIEDNRLYLSRNELDNPHKAKTWKIYSEHFAVELIFIEP